MGKHNHVWHISACLGDYIGVQGLIFPCPRERGVTAGEELRGKYRTHTLNRGKTLLRERCI